MIEILNSGAALIRIIGSIYTWYNNSADILLQIAKLEEQNVNKLKVYINSYGGSVFQANEIANILTNFNGEIEFELGAVCASAATILVIQTAFAKKGTKIKQFQNGQFMIHNVSGDLSGQIKQIESGLQLMRNLEKNIIDNYVSFTGIEIEKIIEYMDKESWFNANLAKELGFIHEVITNNVSDADNLAEIANCGYENLPSNLCNLVSNSHNNQNQFQMDILTKINQITGKNFMNEADAQAYITNMVVENTRLKSELEAQVVAVKNKEIDNILNDAIAQKKIIPSQKESYRKLLNDSFDTASNLIKDLKPVVLASNRINDQTPDNTADTYAELAQKNPEKLKELFENDFTAFNDLFKAEYGYDYLK